MMRANFSITILTLLLVPALVVAETITYEHQEKALFSLTFPADWYVDTDVFDEARAAGLEEVEYAVALFEPQPEVIAVALYVGLPQTWEKHQQELSSIVGSLTRAGS